MPARRVHWPLTTVTIALAACALNRSVTTPVVDPSTTHLWWGLMQVFVIADSTEGVGIWALTTQVAEDQGVAPRQYIGRYDPRDLEAWLRDIDLPASPPPLPDYDGGQMTLTHGRDRASNADRVVLDLKTGSDTAPTRIVLEPRYADQLITALRGAAARSRLNGPVPVLPSDPRVDAPNCPWGDVVRRIDYPRAMAYDHVGGEVWFTVVIGADGRPDVDRTYRALLTNHADFAKSVADGFREATFARCGGSPAVTMRIFMRVTYQTGPG